MKSVASVPPVLSSQPEHADPEFFHSVTPLDPDTETDPQPSAAPLPTVTAARKSPNEVSIFISTFFTIFLAELGDKTQLTTLLMSAESQAPWVVFAGAGSALIATSLLGVLVGRWLATRVSERTLETFAGTIMLCVAVMLLWDVVHL